MSRVVLAAWFVVASGAAERLALLGAASASDLLDGWLARRHNAVSRWGALIDPIADRIFALAAISSLLASGHLTVVEFAVLLFRDVMTAIGFLVARLVRWLRPIRFRARPLGKLVTVLQLGAVLAAIGWRPALPALVVAVGVTSAAATADYTVMLWRERDRTLKP
jgi:phosphatidylglycerophosphate synthase